MQALILTIIFLIGTGVGSYFLSGETVLRFTVLRFIVKIFGAVVWLHLTYWWIFDKLWKK